MFHVRAVLVALIVVWLLSHRRRFWRRLRLALLSLIGKRRQAGELAWQEGTVDERGESALYLADAVNHGEIQAMLPLGQLFEEADEPHHAVLVYNVLEHRTRDLSPFLNAVAQERLDILLASRMTLPEGTTARVPVRDTNVVIQPPPAPKNDTVPPIEIRSDAHNVHDSGVTKSLQVTYNKLKEAGAPTMSLTQCLKEIRECCGENSKALKTLDSIERSSTGVACLNGEREVDVLHCVWNRVCSKHDSSVKDILVSQLADSVDERGITVCTNGRVSRIVDTLSVVDPLVMIKPRWATRQEILGLASKLRTEHPDDDEFKQVLREQARQQYVETGLMAQKLLDIELDSWIDSV